jgi:hypothetical protein
MTLDGITTQIPNASVYKSNIRNFTSNTNRREVFGVGIGFDDSIIEAQEIVFPLGIPVTVLQGKPADAQGSILGKGLPPESRNEELAAVSTKAEAGLYSEAAVIEEQARQAKTLQSGENLLPVATGNTLSEEQAKETKQ